MFGPNVTITTAGHQIQPVPRAGGAQYPARCTSKTTSGSAATSWSRPVSPSGRGLSSARAASSPRTSPPCRGGRCAVPRRAADRPGGSRVQIPPPGSGGTPLAVGRQPVLRGEHLGGQAAGEQTRQEHQRDDELRQGGRSMPQGSSSTGDQSDGFVSGRSPTDRHGSRLAVQRHRRRGPRLWRARASRDRPHPASRRSARRRGPGGGATQ